MSIRSIGVYSPKTNPECSSSNNRQATDLLQREVLIVELEDDVEVGGGVPIPDVGGDDIPVVPDPLEVYRRLPLRPRGTTTRAAAACTKLTQLRWQIRINEMAFFILLGTRFFYLWSQVRLRWWRRRRRTRGSG